MMIHKLEFLWGWGCVNYKAQQLKDISLKIKSNESQVILVLRNTEVLNIFPKKDVEEHTC